MKVGFDELHYRMVTDDEDEIMPPNADPLAAEQIALFMRWQKEGETFDGDDPDASLAEIIPGLKHPDPPRNIQGAIPVTAVAFANGDQSILTSGYHEVLVWSAKDGELQRRISGLPERIHSIDIHPGGKQVAIAGGGPDGLVKSGSLISRMDLLCNCSISQMTSAYPQNSISQEAVLQPVEPMVQSAYLIVKPGRRWLLFQSLQLGK